MTTSNFNFLMRVTSIPKKEIADYLGVTPQQVNDWDKGYRAVPKKYFSSINKCLGTKIDDINNLKIEDMQTIRDAVVSKVMKDIDSFVNSKITNMQ